MAPVAVLAGVALTLRGRRVLAGIDLALGPGETLALLGPNGAGKTSLMRLVAGQLPPDEGTVRVGGADPHRSGAARRTIGRVPQGIALYPRLTVAENLSVFAQFAGLGRQDRREAVGRALALAGIGPVADRIVATLSGGYQRRVNIAVGLIDRPALVLLDEPTNGVDLAARSEIHAVLQRLQEQGTAILLATHDFAEAERLADRVAFLSAGRIVREGRLADLLARLRAGPPERELILDALPDRPAEAVLRRAGFAPADASFLHWRTAERASLDGAALLGMLRAQGVPVCEVRVRAPRLETLYRDSLRAHGPGEPDADGPPRPVSAGITR